MIKNIVFDLGGVVITLAPEQAARRFEAMGLHHAADYLNSYTQQGIFGELEGGRIDEDTFRREFGKLVGHEVDHDSCAHAWQGYFKELPQRNLDALVRLRQEGFRLILLSNTNPFMMELVGSDRFDGQGHSVDAYFDACYLSYQLKMMKPSPDIFIQMMQTEGIEPADCLFVDDGERNVATAAQLGMRTFCPVNGEDWTQKIYQYLK